MNVKVRFMDRIRAIDAFERSLGDDLFLCMILCHFHVQLSVMLIERNMIVSSYSFWKAAGHFSIFIRYGTSIKGLDRLRKLLSIFGLELSEFTDVGSAE